MSVPKYNIYVSYHSEDSEIVTDYCKTFQKAKLSIYKHEINDGKNSSLNKRENIRAMEDSYRFMCFFSTEYIKHLQCFDGFVSCQNDVKTAFDLNKQMIIMHLEHNLTDNIIYDRFKNYDDLIKFELPVYNYDNDREYEAGIAFSSARTL